MFHCRYGPRTGFERHGPAHVRSRTPGVATRINRFVSRRANLHSRTAPSGEPLCSFSRMPGVTTRINRFVSRRANLHSRTAPSGEPLCSFSRMPGVTTRINRFVSRRANLHSRTAPSGEPLCSFRDNAQISGSNQRLGPLIGPNWACWFKLSPD
jgi:hypothetical protein